MMYGNRTSFKPVKVGEELSVEIEATGEKGDGICKKKGFVLFVPNAKQGDKVKIKITKVLNKVGFAEVIGEADVRDIEKEEEPEPAMEPEPEPEDSEDFGEEPNEDQAEEPGEEESPEEPEEEPKHQEDSEEDSAKEDSEEESEKKVYQ